MKSSTRSALALTVLVGLLGSGLAGTAASAGGASGAPRAHAPRRNPWRAAHVDAAAVRNGAQPQIRATGLRTFTLQRAAMQVALAAARPGTTGSATVVLPNPAGTFRKFAVHDSPVMMPRLAAAHPEIRTYAGSGVDATGARTAESVRIAMTPLGFTASVRGPSGSWYVDSVYHLNQSVYASYFGRALADIHGPFVEHGVVGAHAAPSDGVAVASAPGPVTGGSLRTYRLAVLTDPSFAAYWGAGNALAGLVTNLNRAEQIYNDELDVSLLLADNEPNAQLNTIAQAFEPNGPCGGAACFTQGELEFCSGATLVRNRTVLGQLVGADNYDAGHVTLSNDGGGIAALGVIGGSLKALGCTGIPDADGDAYVVDYWTHEMGHNFGMNHTFDGDMTNCSGGNRHDATAVEPGSGTSIMAYAGICEQDDTQAHSDPYFSQRSDEEAQAFMASHRANVTEVQNVSLSHFGGGNEVQTVTFAPQPRETNGFDPSSSSFRVKIGTKTSAVIGGAGEAYNDTGIQNAINAIAGFGGTVAVHGADETGFTVTYKGTTANTDVANLAIVNLSCGGCYSAVDESNHGGKNDSFALRYDGGTTSKALTYGSGYTLAKIKTALEAILPAGATVDVASFGEGGDLDNTGFQVTFGGTLDGSVPAGRHVATLTLANLSAGVSGFAAKTVWGGPVLNRGYTVTATGNTPPLTTAPASFTIPYRTPFALTGGATDADGDTVTYMWEQNDPGTGTLLTAQPKTNGALFRIFGTRLDNSVYDPHAYGSCEPPGAANGENCVTTNPTRVFPDLAQVLAGNTNARTGTCAGTVPSDPSKPLAPALVDCLSEWLPTSVYAGPMHFRLTARDGHAGAGGISSADTTVNLAPGTGPFLVTSQSQAASLPGGSTQKVTWKVAGTASAPIGTAKVDILLSKDGGKTFTVLLKGTPNDGGQRVSLPAVTAKHARIEVRAVGNVFFAVNAHEFTITAAPLARFAAR